MSLQNRVNPEGRICVSGARGTLMGNRGCLHNDRQDIVATSKRDAWVTCLLEFQGRHRQIMAPGHYTELFFLDEATALAAGHRPCATCRRDRYDAFMTAWSRGNREAVRVLVGEVDKEMKKNRAPGARQTITTLTGLPDGVMVKSVLSGAVLLVHGDKLFPWSFHGYGVPILRTSAEGEFDVLTPRCTVDAIRSGFEVSVHASARVK